MIFTARQIEDLHKTNGHISLPVGARLTPMASDWLKSKRLSLVFDGQLTAKPAALDFDKLSRGAVGNLASTPAPAGVTLWWCDGPCGAAKAALASLARESTIQPMSITAEPKYIVAAVKQLASEIKNDRASAGVFLVQTGAAAMVYANRCPTLRAILGTCRDAVQQGVDQLAANVLVIETPYQSLQQTKNLLGQFLKMRRTVSDDVKHRLQELASCG